MIALLAIAVVLLAYIAIKLEQIEKHARRAQMSDVDREMEELNPRGIST